MATGVSLSQLDHFCPSAIELASSVGCLGYQNTSLERKDMINLCKVSYTCAQSKINSIHLFIDDHILSIFYHHLFFFLYSAGLVHHLYLDIRSFPHVKLFIILGKTSKMFIAFISVVMRKMEVFK